ncbi:MAG: Fic family protein, partial [Geminicoccaceae bacterium]
MRRDDLSHAVRRRLQRLPEPFAAHYGVVPLPPPEDGIPLGDALPRHQAASEALAWIDALASELR